MKTRIETPQAVVSGKAEVKAMTIVQDHKTFRAFSDGLYSDKISSVIREISSNAVDAQRESGNLDTPFEVFLPCVDNPKIVFRDYGTGLTKEQIDTIYTRYGASTKENQNDDIGGFGLGSKTPYAYTDQFCVRSYINGTLLTYVFYFSADEPQYALVGEEPTNEPNGLEIYFSVDDCDFEEFSRKAKNILPWMKVVPNVWETSSEDNGFFVADRSEANNLRNTMIKEKNESIWYEDDLMIIGHFPHLNKLSIEQGGVVYDANVNNVDIEELSIIRFANLNIPSKPQLILKCPIGTVELARSRETISWSRKHTVPNVKEMCQAIIDRSVAAYKKASSSFTSDFQRKKMQYNLLVRNLSSNEFAQTLTFNKEEFYIYHLFLGYIQSENITNMNRSTSTQFTYEFDENHNWIGEDCSVKIMRFNKGQGNYRSLRCTKYNDSFKINPFAKNSPVRVIFRDGKSVNLNTAIKSIVSSEEEILLVFSIQKSVLDKKQTKKDWFQKNALHLIKDKLGAIESDLNITYESDYKLKPSVANQPSMRNDYSIFGQSFTSRSGYETHNKIDFLTDKTVVAVKKEGHEVNVNNNVVKRRTFFNNSFQILSLIDYNYDYLVAVNPKELKAIQSVAKKVVYIEDVVKDFDKKPSLDQSFINFFKDFYHKDSLKTLCQCTKPSGYSHNHLSNFYFAFAVESGIMINPAEVRKDNKAIESKLSDLKNNYSQSVFDLFYQTHFSRVTFHHFNLAVNTFLKYFDSEFFKKIDSFLHTNSILDIINEILKMHNIDTKKLFSSKENQLFNDFETFKNLTPYMEYIEYEKMYNNVEKRKELFKEFETILEQKKGVNNVKKMAKIA